MPLNDDEYRQKIRDEFDPFSEYYDEYVQGEKIRGTTIDYTCPAALAQLILTTANPSATDKILDLGVGTGISSQCITKAIEGINITGIDLSIPMLKKAQEKQCLNSYICADISTPLPFKDNTFNHTMSCSVFEFLEGKEEQTITEMARVTKKGGTISIAAIYSDAVKNYSNPTLDKIKEQDGIGYTVNEKETPYIYAVYQKK